jgi:acetoin utilization deacetylase AcuC-like enzyme
MGKYAALREALLTDGTLDAARIRDPGLAPREVLTAAHDAGWVDAVLTHAIDRDMERRIGLPATPALTARARAAVAGTLAAARAALADGVASNLAGGTHHAGRGRGAGFCVFNDLAVTALTLLREGSARRVAVVDLDVHQGDGTHEICQGNPAVFTFSMHGARNFPRVKVPGTLDVALPDGAGDGLYLELLEAHLPSILDGFAPDLVLYQGGVDPLRGDRFGRLALSLEGLRARDRAVLAACRARGLPVATVLGGGYARDLARTVEAHANTIREAASSWHEIQRRRRRAAGVG